MSEVLFYHLSVGSLDRSLPFMLEKSLERGWRVVVRCGSQTVVDFLDRLLWTYSDTGFLPHAASGADIAGSQPVWLTTGTENPNNASVLMLVEGARAAPEELSGFSRTCLIFDGNQPEQLAAARSDWRAFVAAGLKAVYWAQESGRWAQKATS